ncbi:hypothetical protein GII36_01690 [Candidatus Mycosynbacter amalyticus]|uniref:Methyltransferase domain-containing protein n=1 Tax=Candidatus Mycosynbacter amalyticus TaxID=2665156 RepID=A0A857MPG4_9BACT|nr:hypothetical protein [Candidatus Mycosynbacter amalyticus]QHN42560.1 hypothetical protein GII36_01690 [Candidatus Mycosynbacter amalyticus]
MLTIFVVIVAVILLVFLGTVLVGAPYVPTQQRELAEAFDELRPLGKDDVVLDIGSGDGVVLRAAALRGAQAVGYELNPFLVVASRLRLRHVKPRPRVELRNLWTTQFPDDVTLVYTFGESRDIAKMYQKVEQEAARLGRPLEFVSYGFAVPSVAATRQHRAHFLYHISPLHPEKPQV